MTLLAARSWQHTSSRILGPNAMWLTKFSSSNTQHNLKPSQSDDRYNQPRSFIATTMKTTRSSCLFAVGTAVLLFFLPLASAWGTLGHEIVANIAWQRVTPTTRQAMMGLLGLKYGSASTIILPRRSHVSLQTLSDAVKNKWKEFEAADFKMLVEAVTLSSDRISQLEFPATVTVESLRKGFSDFKEAEAYTYAGVTSTTTDSNKFPLPASIEADGE